MENLFIIGIQYILSFSFVRMIVVFIHEFVENLFIIGIQYILPFSFVIMIVVFVHEMGHFWIARKCGVRVDTFSIGFGRKVISWQDKHGTIWKICWIPLGGYVKFFGDANASTMPDIEKLESLSPREKQDIFHMKPLWQRISIVLAGPMANFLLAIVIFASLFLVLGETITLPIIDSIQKNTPAEQAGLQRGDLILNIDKKKIKSFKDVRRIVTLNPNKALNFLVERRKENIDLTITPQLIEKEDAFGNQFMIGYLGITGSTDQSSIQHIRYNPVVAIKLGIENTFFIITETFKVIKKIILGQDTFNNLGGPIRIAQISGQMASVGFIPLINLTAILSVSIGIINLFPIPTLDGGHLFFYLLEGIRKKPISQKIQIFWMRIGLIFMLSLFALITFNDFRRIF